MSDAELEDAIADFAIKRDRQQRAYYARRPKHIRNVLARLVQRRGYGRVQTDQQLQKVWQSAAGRAARHSRALRIRGGKLEVLVANSTVLQQLAFQKERILSYLRQQLPDADIQQIRFRVGNLP